MRVNPYYKCTDVNIGLFDWIALGTDAVPTDVVMDVVTSELTRLNAPTSCPACDGTGYVEDKVGGKDSCIECGGSGEQLRDEMLNSYPASYGTMWQIDTNESAAHCADLAGFEVYESEQFACTLIGIDGGGYNFWLEHWLPFRVALAWDAIVTHRAGDTVAQAREWELLQRYFLDNAMGLGGEEGAEDLRTFIRKVQADR